MAHVAAKSRFSRNGSMSMQHCNLQLAVTVWWRSGHLLKSLNQSRKKHGCLRTNRGKHHRLELFICPGDPHQRNPNATKFEDRSQEETEWQERWAREAAWKLAKSVLKF